MIKHYDKQLLGIALPAMAEMILQLLMGMVDTYLVAFLGLTALSGVAVASNLIAIYQALFIALGAGISALMAQYVGKKGQEMLGQIGTEGLKLTLLLSLVLGLFSWLGGEWFLRLLGTEEAVAKAGGLYLTLVGGGIVFLGLMTSLGAMVRVTARPRLPMYVSLLSNLLNAIFSAIAVFGFQAGIAGVALGTVLSRMIGCGILLWQLGLPLARPSWRLHRPLLSLVLPAAGERLMMRAGDVVVVGFLVSLGTAVVAGNSVGEALTQFNYMPAMGLATATVILTAQHREEIAEVEKIRRASLRLSLLMMFLIALTIFGAASFLIGLYTSDSLAVATAHQLITYSLLGVPVTAATLLYTAIWQGLGNAKLPFYATSMGMWGVRILSAFLLLRWTHLGAAAVWIGTILDNLFRSLFLAYLYQRKRRQIEREREYLAR